MGFSPRAGRQRKGCRPSFGGLPTRLGSSWTGLTHRPSWCLHDQVRGAAVLAGRAISVPFRAQPHRSATVNHGHCCPFDLGALYYRCAATRMVRLGSPVRFRRGAPPQTSSSGRIRCPACRLPESGWTPFARGLPARFVRLSRGGICGCGAAIMGDQPWPATGLAAGGAPGEPHHSSAGADDHGVPQDLPEQAVARRWCEARHEQDIGYRSAPGGIDADPSHPRRALRHRCCRCGSAQVFSSGLSARGVGP
jgi:hypothetical protein